MSDAALLWKALPLPLKLKMRTNCIATLRHPTRQSNTAYLLGMVEAYCGCGVIPTGLRDDVNKLVLDVEDYEHVRKEVVNLMRAEEDAPQPEGKTQ